MSGLRLYTYFRSSAAYRVRIALNLKGLEYESRFVHLLNHGGEQNQASYQEINPQGLVPAMIIADNDQPMTQSLAIIEYLNERYPSPPLLPDSIEDRAFVRSLALMVCCDTHPLNNLRVLSYLKNVLDIEDEKCQAWYQHWVAEGLSAIEKRLNAITHDSPFCCGNSPTLADICLIPQIYNAIRFKCDIQHYSTLRKIYSNCMALDAFDRAAPENQPDYE